MRHGSAFLCQRASTDQRRPVGILTNLPAPKSRLSLHWPILERCGDESCSCDPPHAPFRGTDAQEHFVSSSSKSPGTVFRTVCLADFDMDSFFSLRDGGSIPSQYRITHSHSLRVLTPGQHSILIGWTAHCRGLCFLWHSRCFAGVVVFFHFTSSRATPLSLVLSPHASQSPPVSSSSLLQSSLHTWQSSRVPSSSLLQPSLSLVTGFSHRQYVHRSRSPSRGAASRRFSLGPLECQVTPRMAIQGLMVVPGLLVRATVW